MIFILLVFVPLSSTFDIELEDVIKYGDNFVESLNKDVQEYHSVQKELNEDILPIFKDDIIKFPSKLMDYRKTADKIKKPVLPVIDKDKFYAVAQYLQQNGYERLKTLDKLIKDKLGIKYNLNPFSESTSRMLKNKIFDYVKLILEQGLTTATVIDLEFMIIDLIDASNEFLLDALNNTLTNVTSKYQVRYTENMKTVLQRIYIDVISEKKDNFWYICNKFSICRPYPAFSDYFANLIPVVITTNLTDFFNLTGSVKKALEAKYVFFEKIIHESVYKDIVTKMNSLMNENIALKDLLLHLRFIIINRHKLSNTKENLSKTKIKAAKILIDIIDQAFDVDGPEIVELNFNVVINGLTAWKIKQRMDIQKLVVLFINFVVDTLKSNITPYVAEEIKTLTEIIWNGYGTNQDMFNMLFIRGSKYVTGIEARAGIDYV